MSKAGRATYDLPSPPSDGVTRVLFGQSSDVLLASSWDCSLSVYDLDQKGQTAKIAVEEPLLDCAFAAGSDAVAFAGSLDGSLLQFDLATGQVAAVGAHSDAVKTVNVLDNGQIVTGSWDGTLKLWDTRAPAPLVQSTATHAGCKVYAVDVFGTALVAGLSDRVVQIYDTRKLGAFQQERTSPLQHQTRAVRCSTDGKVFVVTSIEGRVAVEFFDPAEDARKYAFKCHRQKAGNTQTLYPVNAVVFNKQYGSFATGGADGYVYFWDYENKRKIASLSAFPAGVSCLDFNRSGTSLAVGVSYTWEKGDVDHPKDAISIVAITNQTQPKSK